MAYSFDQVFAADPANPSNIAQNASILIYQPGDATKTPLVITDPSGGALSNPVTVNANGFGPAFAHATLDRVAWDGGGFTGFFTSYEGMKNEAIAARDAAQEAATTAGTEAAAVATAAIGSATSDAAAAATSAANAQAAANASAQAAANSAALVGAPADTAMATVATNTSSAFRGALNATFVPTAAKGVAAGVATLDADSKTVEERAYVANAARPRRPLVKSIVEQFASGHGWTNFSSTAATVTDDTADYALGTQSLKVVTKSDNTAGSVQKSGLSLNLTGKQLMVWVKVEGGTASLTELIMYAGDTTLANNYSWTMGDAGGTEQQVWREGEWTPIVVSFADAAVTGTPNRAAIATLRLRARALNGVALTLHYGGIATLDEPTAFPNGVISFTCDDSYASQYDVMRPILDKYGWASTAYTIVDLLGTPGFMTLDQLKQLEQASGWEVAGHAFTNAMHTKGFGTGSTLAETEADIRSLRKWLIDNKFRGADHLAYPKGFFTIDSQKIMGKYFATGRTVTNRLAETIRPSDRMRLRSLSVTNTITLATAKKLVDGVKAGKAWGIITIHDLVTSPTVGAQWATADFQALVDYIAAAGIPVMTVGEVNARLDTPDPQPGPAGPTYDPSSILAAIDQALGNTTGKVNAMRRPDATASLTITAGTTHVTCFTPIRDLTITKLAAACGGTAWAGSTLTRIGLYTVDSAGAATLVAATASDTTMFAAASTVYQGALSTAGGLPASYTLTAGTRYAIGVIGVGTTAGSLRAGSVLSSLASRLPILGGNLGTAQTDLPTSGTISANGTYPWAEAAA